MNTAAQPAPARAARPRRPALSPGGLLLRACELALPFALLHLCGARRYVSILCGTFEAGAAPVSLPSVLGLLYALAWVAATVVAPMLLLAALLLHLSGGRRPVPPAVTTAGLVLLLLLPLTELAPQAWHIALGRPSAWLAAAWLGAPLAPAPEGYWILQPALPVCVTPACSGAGFFALFAALVAGRLAGAGLPPGLRALALVGTFPAAYAVTLVANASRLVLGWAGGLFAHNHLPARLQAGAHLLAGIVVFLFFLSLTHVLLTVALARSRPSRPTPEV